MSRNADKILQKMRRTKSGWKRKDFQTLFEGHGFERKGRKRDIYFHPDHHQVRATVPRQNKLKEYVTEKAIEAIEMLIKLQAEGEQNG